MLAEELVNAVYVNKSKVYRRTSGYHIRSLSNNRELIVPYWLNPDLDQDLDVEKYKDGASFLEALPVGTKVVAPEHYWNGDYATDERFAKFPGGHWFLVETNDFYGETREVSPPAISGKEPDTIISESQARMIASTYTGNDGAIRGDNILLFGQDIVDEVRNKTGIYASLKDDDILACSERLSKEGALKDKHIPAFTEALIRALFKAEDDSHYYVNSVHFIL